MSLALHAPRPRPAPRRLLAVLVWLLCAWLAWQAWGLGHRVAHHAGASTEVGLWAHGGQADECAALDQLSTGAAAPLPLWPPAPSCAPEAALPWAVLSVSRGFTFRASPARAPPQSPQRH